MKVRHFLILGGFVLLLGLIYYPILGNEEKEEKVSIKAVQNFVPVVKVMNKSRLQTLVSYGQVLPNNQIDVSMEVQGAVRQDNRLLKSGMNFKKGELLIQLERIEALYNLLGRRSAFANLVSGILPDISIDFPNEKQKWEDYLNKLEPTEILPELPSLNSRKERLLVNQRNINSEFYAVKALENQLEKYFYFAPFDGTIVSSVVEPGSMVTPGMRVLTIAKTNDYEVRAPISLAQLDLYKNSDEVIFTSSHGELIGKGKFERITRSINQQTQSVDAFFSLKPHPETMVFQGMFLNLKLESELYEESMAIPETAIRNGIVQLLSDSLIVERNADVIGNLRDSVLIKGIGDEELIVLEPVSQFTDSTRFIGVLK